MIMNEIRFERLWRALVIWVATICGTLLAMIPHPIAYALAGGSFLYVLLSIWQIIQPDVWHEKRLADQASFLKTNRRFVNAIRAIGILAGLAWVVLEILKSK
jgi:hypothetical protein